MPKRLFWSLFALCCASLGGQIALYPSLPAYVPLHWNLTGQIDGWGPKLSALVFAALPLALLLVLRLLPVIDPRRESYQQHRKAYSIFSSAVVVVFCLISWGTVLPALGLRIPMERALPALVGVLLVVLGNYMPQLRPNFFMGIRSPWALSDEAVWRKTHRAGGIVFCASGVLLTLAAFWPGEIPIMWILPGFFLAVAALYLYSYLVWRKQQGSHKED